MKRLGRIVSGGYPLDSGKRHPRIEVGRAPSPAAGPLAGSLAAGRGSGAVQGDRPTKPLQQRLPESRG